ncbi:hypothetical protein [Thiobacillus sp.]
MALGKKTGGRLPGSPNRMTSEVRDAILRVADDLGGPERMLSWAREAPENEKIFWSRIYPKLLPRDMNVAVTQTRLESLVAGDDGDND